MVNEQKEDNVGVYYEYKKLRGGWLSFIKVIIKARLYDYVYVQPKD